MERIDKKITDDDWAKENKLTLERNTCNECLVIWNKGEKNSLGQTCFCCPAHAYEVSNLKKNIYFDDRRNKLLSAIDTNKLSFEEAKDIISEIEERYY